MRDARERRQECVRDGDAMRAAPARRLHAFDGLAQAAPEGDGDDDVFRRDVSCQVDDLSRCRRRECAEPEKDEVIFEVIGENGGKIAPDDDHATCAVKALRGCAEPFCVESVLQRLQILRSSSSESAMWPGMPADGAARCMVSAEVAKASDNSCRKCWNSRNPGKPRPRTMRITVAGSVPSRSATLRTLERTKARGCSNIGRIISWRLTLMRWRRSATWLD